MKTLLFFLVLLPASLSAVYAQESGSLQALSDKYGFRDAHFESPPSAFSDLVLASPGKVTKGYYRRNDSKKIGGAQVANIYYSFYKGKLASVLIKTKGLGNSRALLDALKAQYGEPEKPNQFLEEYEWLADRVKMSYKQNSVTDDATIVMFSTYMLVQQKEDEATTAKKAASDL